MFGSQLRRPVKSTGHLRFEPPQTYLEKLIKKRKQGNSSRCIFLLFIKNTVKLHGKQANRKKIVKKCPENGQKITEIDVKNMDYDEKTLKYCAKYDPQN